MKHKIISAITVLIAILVAIGPKTIFPVCAVHSDMVMRCHYTAQMSLGLGISLLGLAIFLFLSRTLAFQKGIYIGQAILGILIILTPTVLIGVCESPMMHCHSTTSPILILLGVFVIILAVIGYFFNGMKKHEK
ncbi:MAG: DUF4418 family protein [Streptococcaceae bacterium]|jgi:hypothetical protein|nr:DUF4418 family protein [Streptococcaceae bacterium]